jgi:hypothetical protein
MLRRVRRRAINLSERREKRRFDRRWGKRRQFEAAKEGLRSGSD